MIVRCEWFAGCIRRATWLVRHPVLGDVPACGECVRFLELAGRRYDVNVWDREPEDINVGELAW